MYRERSRFLIAVLTVILLLGLAVCAAAEVPEGYERVAGNEKWTLYLKEDRLSVILEDAGTGAQLVSTLTDETIQGKNNKAWKGYLKSGLVLSVIRDGNNTYQADLINNEHTLEYEYTTDGFSATVYYPEYGTGLTVEVTLNGDELLVRIPDTSIREDLDGVYIATISPFPLLGCTYLGETEGYMLIPDGNGALIDLTDKEKRFSSGFSQLIYGPDAGFRETSAATRLWGRYRTVTDTHTVLAPVFGMAHTADGIAYLAVVEDGAERCSLEAQPNGVMVGYNRCFARFLLRDIYQQPLNQSNSGSVKTVEQDRTHTDRSVRYCLLSGEEADYSGMAIRYRQYLLEKGIVIPVDTAYRTRIDLLNADRENFLIGTRPVVMTTVEQVDAILKDLRGAGAGKMLCILRGWQNGGINALPVDRYAPDGTLGSAKEMSALIQGSEATGDRILLYTDALRMNADTTAFTYDAVKMVNKRTLEETDGGQVYDKFYWLLPQRSGEKLLSLARSLRKDGQTALAVGGITENLFSWYLKGKYYSRPDCLNTYASVIAEARQECALALETPFQYLWKDTDAFLNMPLSSSDYMYVDREVPFMSMTLSGLIPMYSEYVNFEANKTEFFLKMAESGVYPSFILTAEDSSALIYTNSSDLYSTRYDTYRTTVLEYDARLRALAAQTAGAYIVRHEYLSATLTRVTWSTGVTVLINFGETDAAAGTLTVPAGNFLVLDADGKEAGI